MSREFKYYKKTLHFKFSAGTSRGYFLTRDCYFLTVEENGTILGVGECAPIPGLSNEYVDVKSFEDKLKAFILRANFDKGFNLSLLKNESALLFAFEMALLHADRKSFLLFDNAFTQGKKDLKINGLIWMGTYEKMRERIIEKLNAGFKCIKIKIGAIDFDKELELLKLVRSEFNKKDLVLRVDANGAFNPQNALDYLEKLAKYDLHSIEQPIKAGQIEDLSLLCQKSPISIALDEELIGVTESSKKQKLLERIKPQYIVLKPSLHGGLKSSIEWLKIAQRLNINYWITSALESNIGLNALAQFAGSLNLEGYQGLGTGQLYHDNIDFPALKYCGQTLSFDKSQLEKIDVESYIA